LDMGYLSFFFFFLSCFLEHVFCLFLHSPYPFSYSGNFGESGHGTICSFILWVNGISACYLLV
jgi:hypothetical protein